MQQTKPSLVGTWIYNERLNRGWSVDQVAALLRVSQPRVTDWERGKYLPSARYHVGIAAFLRRPVDEVALAVASDQRRRDPPPVRHP